MNERLDQQIASYGKFALKATGIALLALVVAGPFIYFLSIPLRTIGIADAVFLAVIGGAYLAASFTVIRMFVELAKRKGYFQQGGVGWLWFIGVCTTPITLGLLVMMLPSVQGVDAAASEVAPAVMPKPVTESDLPSF